MSSIDYKENKLHKNEARKQISKIVGQHSENIVFSRHALVELGKDDLTVVDALNIIKSPDSKIAIDGELQNGSFRYRLETAQILVVVSFSNDGTGLTVVTAWKKKKGSYENDDLCNV